MKVLVVDDSERLAYIVRAVLEAAGHEVRTARDGPEGYLSYLRFQADLVITDIEMPGQTGLEMMREIRRHDPHVRTVYMSGDMERFGQVLADEKQRHRVGLLKKPFSRAELTQQVADAAQRRALG